ncbi:hypothetical protein ACFWG5_33170 [Streptomyces hydrogenans]|uniref:hypothetical protein n=1 Tax=Streptomyces hydrogenans TaxID=1873719 RepID=UPI003657F417
MSPVVTPDADDVPQEYALLVIDMKDYSKIPEAKMAPTLADVESVLSTVFEECGIDDVVTLDNAVKDRGDGSIYVVSARHAARLVDPLLGLLSQALERREHSRLASSPVIRLRASVHVGPLESPGHRGDAVNDACRLVESVAVRRAMDAALDNDLLLAAAVSDPVFDRSVLAARTKRLKVRDFHSATALVNGKPGFAERCWLHVPGLVPTALAPYLSTDGDAPIASSPSLQGQGGADDAPVREKPVVPAGGQSAKAKGKARIVQVGGDYNRGRGDA